MDRDLRIDFMRGVVLLLIVSDHVLNNNSQWFCFGDWYYVDAAPGFVFISGLVCGMVYSRVLASRGYAQTQLKVLRRCGQLYLANLAVFVITLGLVLLFRAYEHVDLGPFGFQALIDDPVAALPRALLLMYTPWLLDILELYMVLLMFLPLMLWLYHRNRLAALAVSAAIYCVAQQWPNFSPRGYPHGLPWFWNPLGWQFLFFGGVWLGTERSRGTLRLPRNAWLIGAVGAAIASIMVIKQLDIVTFPWEDRRRVGPLYLLSFGLLAYLVWACLPSSPRFWQNRPAQTIIACGKHSLTIFCCGVVIDYLISLILITPHRNWVDTVVVGGGVAVTMLIGTALERARASESSGASTPHAGGSMHGCEALG